MEGVNELMDGWRRCESPPHRDKRTLSLSAPAVVVRICVGSSVYKVASLLAVLLPAWPTPTPPPTLPARPTAPDAFPDDDAAKDEEEDAKAWSRPSSTLSRLRLLPSPVDILCGVVVVVSVVSAMTGVGRSRR